MLEKIQVEKLKSIMASQKPYRGREHKEYPYHNRDHGHKYFIPKFDDKGNALWFDIYYYSNVILRVRPDNTVEFMNDRYYQGDIMVMQDMFKSNYDYNDRPEIKTSKANGGLMFIDNKLKIKLACHAGVRVNMVTAQVVPEYGYDVSINYVDKKLSAEVQKANHKLFKEAKVFMSGQPLEVTVEDVLNQWRAPKLVEMSADAVTGEIISKKVTHKNEKDMVENVTSGYDLAICLLADSSAKRQAISWYDQTYSRSTITKEKLIAWAKEEIRHHLNAKHGVFSQKKVFPCEDRWYPSNPRLEIKLRQGETA
jgi:hypothetical protein